MNYKTINYIFLLIVISMLAISCSSIKRNIAIKKLADSFERVDRNPVLRTPEVVGLEFDKIDFKSLDNINLKAWYMPSANSNKIVVFNHFMIGNRAGAIPNKDWGNVTVDFMPIYRSLVDAGYNVFTYDLRNHGESDVHNGGKLGLTHTEYQDIVASVRYVKEQHTTKEIFLYSQCYGSVATMRAMEKHPDDFIGIRAFVNLQPLSSDAFVTGITRKFGIEHESNLEKFSKRLEEKTGYTADQCKAPDLAHAVKVPTLLVQVHDDWRTTPEDIELIYKKLGTDDKKLLWIENETERLEGYNYFARNPSELIDWLNAH